MICETCGTDDSCIAGHLICEGCGCCSDCCNCTETDCDCYACADRREGLRDSANDNVPSINTLTGFVDTMSGTAMPFSREPEASSQDDLTSTQAQHDLQRTDD
jgi:hypothetical protein